MSDLNKLKERLEGFKSRSELKTKFNNVLEDVLDDQEELDTLEAQQRVEKILNGLTGALRKNSTAEVKEVADFVSKKIRDLIREMKQEFV